MKTSLQASLAYCSQVGEMSFEPQLVTCFDRPASVAGVSIDLPRIPARRAQGYRHEGVAHFIVGYREAAEAAEGDGRGGEKMDVCQPARVCAVEGE
jgi:hypothetical protein